MDILGCFSLQGSATLLPSMGHCRVNFPVIGRHVSVLVTLLRVTKSLTKATEGEMDILAHGVRGTAHQGREGKARAMWGILAD